ncbi:MAG TPA: DUF2461 domain-containing protein [Desulfomonilaceae bacterium]|nr:DUF2461 domain-containing protein [Desulfomonilaceae bacterium]
MSDQSLFNGFPIECVNYYAELSKNNNKTWFANHKSDFDTYVMTPARDFVFEMGKRLESIAPKIVADPRVNKSIFRPYRDTRFSKNKTPYKNHLGIFFWEGTRPKMECPGFYFHLEPPYLMLGNGIHCFPKSLLEHFRNSVVDPKLGPVLDEAAKTVTAKGDYTIGGKYYKKTPRGYDPQHRNAAFLLYNGLYAMAIGEIPPEFYSKEIVDFCFERFRDMLPVHRWLMDMINSL